jgi:hypothetical protein
MTGHFIRKPIDLDEVKRETEKLIQLGETPDKIKIVSRVTLTKQAFSEFQKSLFKDYDFIISRTEKCGVKDGIWNCILVSCKDSNIRLAVNPDGFSYARYVALV